MIVDFRDLLAALVGTGARFLVVGAHALAVHGVPRVTGDLDIWVEPSSDNAARVWDALAEFDVSFIGRVAFVRNKRASGRPKDLEDIRLLER